MKYALGIRGRDEDVTLGFAYQGRTLTEWYGSGDDLFDGWWRLPRRDPGDAIARAVEEFRPDLIHSHNLPDLLTVLALEAACGDVPVVHDVHDMQSLRRTPYEDGFDDPEDPLELERAAVEGCAGLIAVSIQMLAELAARYDVGGPVLLFANYALARDLPRRRAPERRRRGRRASSTRGACRPTAATTTCASTSPPSPGRGRDRRVPQPGRAGVPGAGRPHARDAGDGHPGAGGAAAGAAGLRRRLGGLQPRLNAAHLDTALPNKAFEYLASGLPIAAGPHGRCGGWWRTGRRLRGRRPRRPASGPPSEATWRHARPPGGPPAPLHRGGAHRRPAGLLPGRLAAVVAPEAAGPGPRATTLAAG